MGLRELKAQRTRDGLHEALLALADEVGYEAVTVEAIAERAEVGVSTLYRYFPNKDAILLAPVADGVGKLARAFSARPASERRDVALGHALVEYFDESAEDRTRLLRLRQRLDEADGPRARLWDLWQQQRVLLEAAIAEREGTSATALDVLISAHVTTMVLQLAVDRQRDSVDDVPFVRVAEEVIATLGSSDVVIPTLSAS